jgi:hypothetical protein
MQAAGAGAEGDVHTLQERGICTFDNHHWLPHTSCGSWAIRETPQSACSMMNLVEWHDTINRLIHDCAVPHRFSFSIYKEAGKRCNTY